MLKILKLLGYLMLCGTLTYAFVNIGDIVANEQLVEVIRTMFVLLLLLCVCFLWEIAHMFEKDAKNTNYYCNMSRMLMEAGVRNATFHIFRSHVYPQDLVNIKVDIFMPKGLVNLTVVINDQEIEVEPFYFFEDNWAYKIETAKEEYVLQRTGEL